MSDPGNGRVVVCRHQAGVVVDAGAPPPTLHGQDTVTSPRVTVKAEGHGASDALSMTVPNVERRPKPACQHADWTVSR